MSATLREHFKRIAVSTVREVGNDSAVIDQLLSEGCELGLSRVDAVAILEMVVAELAVDSSTELHLAYDTSIAMAGVAGGTTLVVFRVTSASSRSMASVTISIQDPERGLLLTLPPIEALPAGAHREAEIDLALQRVGRQTVRTGFVELLRASGELAVYRIADPIPLTVENGASARTHIHTISQTIQTHGGGVISAGDLTVGTLNGGDQHGRARWQALRLMVATESDIAVLRELQRAQRISPVPSTAATTPRPSELRPDISSASSPVVAEAHQDVTPVGSKSSTFLVNAVAAVMAVGGLLTIGTYLKVTFQSYFAN